MCVGDEEADLLSTYQVPLWSAQLLQEDSSGRICGGATGVSKGTASSFRKNKGWIEGTVGVRINVKEGGWERVE